MSRYAFYTSYPKTWAAMLREIEHAERSIYIEMYIMVDDTPGFDFIGTLEKKSRQGVSVKLVLDSFGSYALSSAAIDSLRKSGGEVLFSSRWLHRLHRKLVIVDGRVAITGGVNIHGSAHGWTDLACRVEGKRTIRIALGSFAKTYIGAGGRDTAVARFARASNMRKQKAEFIHYGPLETRKTLKRLYRAKLAEAEHAVRLVTPYFAPDRWLVQALDQAALRGVSVEILLPEKCDSWFMDRANHFYMQKMAKTNVHFFLFPRMNHAKALVIDEREALVGSQNLDSLSFNINSELGIFLTDRDMVASVSRILETWKKESRPFSAGEYRRQWYDYVLAPLIRIMQPFL